MTYAITNPSRVPHPYPIITIFIVHPLFSSASASGGGEIGCLQRSGSGSPHSPKFPPKEFPWNVLNCFPWGTRWFCDMFKTSRLVISARLWGISPMSWFQERSNDSISQRLPRACGIWPFRLLWDKLSTISELRVPTMSGISPTNLLLDRSIIV